MKCKYCKGKGYIYLPDYQGMIEEKCFECKGTGLKSTDLINWLIKEEKAFINYPGIIEIYPRRFNNTMVLNKTLRELQKDFDLIKVGNSIRAFVK